MNYLKIGLTAVGAVATLALAAPAQAGVPPSFQTPSGNIQCWVADDAASCNVIDYDYALPPPGDCTKPGWGGSVSLFQGRDPVVNCDSDPPGVYHGMRSHVTLDYGQTKAVGAMSCLSEQTGVTCTDTSTGHFFTVSRDTLRLG
jgi:hypothetical protein